MKHLVLLLIVTASLSCAQNPGPPANSLFEQGETRSFESGDILIEGEVRNPGPVDLSRLPVRSAPVKELELQESGAAFRGAYYVTGYALYDILNEKAVEKAPGSDFKPPLDIYAVVENDEGAQVVFSWGEIFYRTSFDILISKSVQPINPVKTEETWPLPEMPRLVCGSDLYNVRYLNNPRKITIRSFRGQFPEGSPETMYVPQIEFLTAAGSAMIGDIGPAVGQKKYRSVHYGHGRGYKGVHDTTGYALKDLIEEAKTIPLDRVRDHCVVVSAKDAYRSVFSLGEILNRNDNLDPVLIDNLDSPRNGRYTLRVPGDFFVDRDVRSVEKIEIARTR